MSFTGLWKSLKLEDRGSLTQGNATADPYAIIAQLQAGCLIAILPLVIIFFILQKQFIKSVTTSGIVG